MSDPTCVACGEPLPPGARFCASCGASQTADTTPEEPAPEAAATSVVTPVQAAQPAHGAASPPGRFRDRRTILLAALTVLVLAGGGVALALSGGDNDSDTTAAAVTEEAEQDVDPTLDTDGDGAPDISDTDPNDAAVGGTDESFEETPDVTDEDVIEEDTEDEDRNLPESTAPVGGTAVDDDVTFKVVSLEAVSSVPLDEYSDGPVTPRDGAKIIKAVITWKNNTGSPQDMFCGGGSARLLDQEQNNYDPMDNYTDLPGNGICGEDVGPGFKRTDVLLFEIPDEQKTAGIALWNGEGEDSGGDTFVFFEK